ncbi:DUF4998 domain-containing protein [Parabacteroides pacaensis]|uniref:DUF4998 domain-containing protein n=1 Tax=Parabacteroides pacaensis TaxID=2086575 RepID=UPI000D0EF2F8|nr:DUF4998 domain-containing protein [Parabacteroides pacaensis]
MRKIKYYMGIVLLSVCVVSCEDVMDIHKEFIKGGEIMYAPNLDSLAVYSGKNRIKLTCWLYNATFVETLHVYWNNGQDSLISLVSLKAGMDSVDVWIPGLKENAYTFEVFTKDKEGVESLKTTGFGSAYGDMFQSNLSPRTIKSHALINESGEIIWNSPDEKLYCTEVKYTRKDGMPAIIRTFPEDIKTECEEIDNAEGYTFRSLFLPEPTAIDTFYTDWSDKTTFPSVIDRTDWEIIFTTTEVAGSYPASALLDGDMNTFWHSDWNVQPPFPYLIVIDMKRNIEVNTVDIYRRLGNTDAKSFKVYVSKDNANWTEGGTYTFNGPELLCSLENALEGRYLKLEFFESNKDDRSVSIAEMYVIGSIK